MTSLFSVENINLTVVELWHMHLISQYEPVHRGGGDTVLSLNSIAPRRNEVIEEIMNNPAVSSL